MFQEHTRQRIRDFEWSDISDELDQSGSLRDPIEVAREKTGWILENHHPQPLPEDQQAELTRILAAADKEFE